VLTVSGKREDDRKVEEGQWIRRERSTGQFRRSISLPPGVDPNKVKANAKNGVIEIRVPRPTKTEPHRVQLGSGNGSKRTEIDVESSRSKTGQGATDQGASSRTSSVPTKSSASKKPSKSSRAS
jgi:HSP20 family protein